MRYIDVKLTSKRICRWCDDYIWPDQDAVVEDTKRKNIYYHVFCASQKWWYQDLLAERKRQENRKVQQDLQLDIPMKAGD